MLPRLGQCYVNQRFISLRALYEEHDRSEQDQPTKPYHTRKSWSTQDTEKLVKLVGKYGNKWKVFANYFPGRTAFCIRSHYFSVTHDTTRWTLEEKKILQQLLQGQNDADKINWEAVQQKLPKKRTVGRIKQFWQNSIQPSLNRGSWTQKETTKLKELVELHGKNFELIAREMGSRSEEQCRNKWAYEVNTLKKGEFTKEEDEALMKGIDKYGSDAFQQIKQDMQSLRSVSQLRTRYTNFLDPTIDKSPWTNEEKETLVRLYKEIGNLKAVRTKINSRRSIKDMYNQLRNK
ncbi:Myblike DNAbinding domain-containing protein [Rhizopus stolonifer]|uniref:Myblike DNAbinding domain-containing protein n=2 Tax=Mucorineae TaxID=1344963 RepID=A0A367KFF8_RHIST|nr:Myblike DNAbinding domain-containing protein [Rhizopus stolonifer]